jgi:signal transduction histidine kinase
MIRVSTWLFRSYLGVLSIVILVQLFILALGIGLAIDQYNRIKEDELSNIALELLIDPSRLETVNLDYSSAFFVFSANKELLYSNRGQGTRITDEQLRPLYLEGSLIGYWFGNSLRFEDDPSNTVLLTTILIFAGLSIFISFFLGLVASKQSAKNIISPVAIINDDIKKLSQRNFLQKRAFRLSELSEISAGVSNVSKVLQDEELYKKQWMQDLAHDLRTPVAGLKSQLEALRDGVLSPSKQRFEQNLTDLERLEQMITDISQLHNLENLSQLNLEKINLNKIIEHIINSNEVQLQSKQIQLIRDLKVKFVSADKRLFERALSNLIVNAIKYAPKDSPLEIRTVAKEKLVEISISNYAPQLPDAQLANVFDRFFRGEYARKSPGSGLGLNIARTIAIKHGGQLSAFKPNPDQILFTFQLPVNFDGII